MSEQPDNLVGIPPAPSMAKRGLQELQAELMARKIESLRLYEPMPEQDEFHRSLAFDRIITGGNRGGKSMCAFVEDARAATNQDPYDKYPKEGALVIVGYGWEHCGKVVYRLLFKPGAFKIIKDDTTGQWRAFRPYDPIDAGREADAKPAPPLIPERFLRGGRKAAFAWTDKKKRWFSSVELTTGWTIYYYPSEGDPEQAQGFPANLGHVDENVHDRRWIAELFARLAETSGRFVWSTIPGEDKTGALDELIDDSDKQLSREKPRIERFDMPFFGNRHIGSAEKKLSIERWSALGEDEVRRRAYGQSGINYLMYPTFSMQVHGFDRKDLPKDEVPMHWTRFMVVDPGHTAACSLFAAVPPPQEHPKLILVFDELYLEQCDGPTWGRKTAEKVGGQYFHTFIIDAHGGNLADMSTGSTWQQVYGRELRKNGIRSQRTGHGFVPGSDDLESRANAVRLALYSADGPPRLRILRGTCPNLVRTIPRYHKKRDKKTKQITDKPETRGDVHAVQCLEYLCAFDPQYHKMPPRKREASAAVRAFREERRQESRQRGAASVSFV